MRILIICGDLWHPAEVVKRGLTHLVDRGLRIDYVTDAKDILTPDMLPGYDVIMNCKGNSITDGVTMPWFEDGVTAVMPGDFEAYVERGGGYISLHAGNTFAMATRPDMCRFIGADYGTHPPQCTVELQVRDGGHPIMRGVENFSFRDEHYQINPIAQDAHTLFETVSTPGGTCLGGYTRQIGAGRLCVLTPGHNYAVLSHPQYRKVLYQAIMWCAKEE